jgi:hypothetical protein
MENRRIAYYHKMFNSAAAFNALVTAAFLLAFEPLYALAGGGVVPPIPLLEMFILIVGVAVGLFGVVYFQAGRRFEYEDSGFLISLGVVGKLAFFVLVLSYTLRGAIPWGMMGVALVDLLYSALFIESLMYKSKQSQQPQS